MGQKPLTVARMDGRVAIAVEDYRGYDLPASPAGTVLACDDGSALAHRGERRRHVVGGAWGEAGVDADRRV